MLGSSNSQMLGKEAKTYAFQDARVTYYTALIDTTVLLNPLRPALYFLHQYTPWASRQEVYSIELL